MGGEHDCCSGPKILKNQKYVGPGIWFTIHSEAKEATSIREQRTYCALIRRLQRNFPCSICRKEFGAYLEKYPPEDMVQNHEFAMFTWSVDFHNRVNERLGKHILSWEECTSLYYPQ